MKQAIFYSIASATVAGLLVGGVMKLGPNALTEFGGPQILISGESGRFPTADGGPGGAAFASYNGEIPEYVLGSDWTQPPEYLLAADSDPYELAAYVPPPVPEIEDAVFVAPVKIISPPAPKPVSYPSLDGDILGGPAPDTLTEVVEAQEDPDHLPS